MNNYIDNVYLINMDKDTERLKKVTTICDKVGIKFQRFSGVKVSDLSQNILDKYIPEEIQKYGTNGMIGCGLSHLFIWQDAVKNNYKNILVLEDDVYFTDTFNEYIINALEEIPNDYDILYLGYKDLYSCEAPKDSSFNYIYKPYFPLLTHAMIISNKGLKKLLNLITKIDNHIDWSIANKKKDLIIYASKKKIINQIWESSNNSNLKSFPKIINSYLDEVYDCHKIPLSYEYNFQIYKYKEYQITRITYIIFNFGVISNIHTSILLLCLLYFACDYDRFHLIVFLLGYFVGYIFKYIINYYKINQYINLCLFVLMLLLFNSIQLPFIIIKALF
jgi:GR25 family glycosyltransferase involved in LPS biosynthesis